MKYSKDGYKRNSKDKNNPYNIIPSGDITMEGVDFPVYGIDNLGNEQIMMPGANYTFPGNQVFEVPLAQGGKETADWTGTHMGEFDDYITPLLISGKSPILDAFGYQGYFDFDEEPIMMGDDEGGHLGYNFIYTSGPSKGHGFTRPLEKRYHGNRWELADQPEEYERYFTHPEFIDIHWGKGNPVADRLREAVEQNIAFENLPEFLKDYNTWRTISPTLENLEDFKKYGGDLPKAQIGGIIAALKGLFKQAPKVVDDVIKHGAKAGDNTSSIMDKAIISNAGDLIRRQKHIDDASSLVMKDGLLVNPYQTNHFTGSGNIVLDHLGGNWGAKPTTITTPMMDAMNLNLMPRSVAPFDTYWLNKGSGFIYPQNTKIFTGDSKLKNLLTDTPYSKNFTFSKESEQLYKKMKDLELKSVNGKFANTSDEIEYNKLKKLNEQLHKDWVTSLKLQGIDPTSKSYNLGYIDKSQYLKGNRSPRYAGEYPYIHSATPEGQSMQGYLGSLGTSPDPDMISNFIMRGGTLSPDDIYMLNQRINITPKSDLEGWLKTYNQRITDPQYNYPSESQIKELVENKLKNLQQGGEEESNIHPFEQWAASQEMDPRQALQMVLSNPDNYPPEVVQAAQAYYEELEQLNAINDKQDEKLYNADQHQQQIPEFQGDEGSSEVNDDDVNLDAMKNWYANMTSDYQDPDLIISDELNRSYYDPHMEEIYLSQKDLDYAGKYNVLSHELHHHMQNYKDHLTKYGIMKEHYPQDLQGLFHLYKPKPVGPVTKEVKSNYYNRRDFEKNLLFERLLEGRLYEGINEDNIYDKALGEDVANQLWWDKMENELYRQPWTMEGDAVNIENTGGYPKHYLNSLLENAIRYKKGGELPKYQWGGFKTAIQQLMKHFSKSGKVADDVVKNLNQADELGVIASQMPDLNQAKTIVSDVVDQPYINVNTVKTIEERATDFIKKEIIDKATKLPKGITLDHVNHATGEIILSSKNVKPFTYNLGKTEQKRLADFFFKQADNEGLFKPKLQSQRQMDIDEKWFYNPTTKRMETRGSFLGLSNYTPDRLPDGKNFVSFLNDIDQKYINRGWNLNPNPRKWEHYLGIDRNVADRFLNTLDKFGVKTITGKQLKTVFPEGFYHGSPQRINSLDDILLEPKTFKAGNSGFYGTSNPQYASTYMDWTEEIGSSRDWTKTPWGVKDPLRMYGPASNRTLHSIEVADDAVVSLGNEAIQGGYKVFNKPAYEGVDIALGTARPGNRGILHNEILFLNKKGIKSFNPIEPSTSILGQGNKIDDLINLDPTAYKLMMSGKMDEGHNLLYKYNIAHGKSPLGPTIKLPGGINAIEGGIGHTPVGGYGWNFKDIPKLDLMLDTRYGPKIKLPHRWNSDFDQHFRISREGPLWKEGGDLPKHQATGETDEYTPQTLKLHNVEEGEVNVEGITPYVQHNIPYDIDFHETEVPNYIKLRQSIAESTLDPTAVSDAGAKGLTQIMPKTLQDYKEKTGDTNIDLFNYEDAMKVQNWYINDLYNASFIANKPNQSDMVRMAKALVAYNWGRTNLYDHLTAQKKAGVNIYDDKMSWLYHEDIPEESRNYLKKILWDNHPQMTIDYDIIMNDKDKYKTYLDAYDYKKKGGEKKKLKALWKQYKKWKKGENLSSVVLDELKDKKIVTSNKIKPETQKKFFRIDPKTTTISFADSYDLEKLMVKKVSRGSETSLTLNQQINFYNDYINSVYDNTPQFNKATNLYDKINRLYVLDAKKKGGSIFDYMKSLPKFQGDEGSSETTTETTTENTGVPYLNQTNETNETVYTVPELTAQENLQMNADADAQEMEGEMIADGEREPIPTINFNLGSDYDMYGNPYQYSTEENPILYDNRNLGALVYYTPDGHTDYFTADLERMYPYLDETYGAGNWKAVELPQQAYTDEWLDLSEQKKNHPGTLAYNQFFDTIDSLYMPEIDKLTNQIIDVRRERSQIENHNSQEYIDLTNKITELKGNQDNIYQRRDDEIDKFRTDFESNIQTNYPDLYDINMKLGEIGSPLKSGVDIANEYFTDVKNLKGDGHIFLMQHGDSRVGPLVMSETDRQKRSNWTSPGVVDTFAEVLSPESAGGWLPDDNNVICYGGMCGGDRYLENLTKESGVTTLGQPRTWSGYQSIFGDDITSQFFNTGPEGVINPDFSGGAYITHTLDDGVFASDTTGYIPTRNIGPRDYEQAVSSGPTTPEDSRPTYDEYMRTDELDPLLESPGRARGRSRITRELSPRRYGEGGSLPENQVGGFKHLINFFKNLGKGSKSKNVVTGLDDAISWSKGSLGEKMTMSQVDDVIAKRKGWVNSDEYLNRRMGQMKTSGEYDNIADEDIIKFINKDVKRMEDAFDQVTINFKKDNFDASGTYSGDAIDIKVPDPKVKQKYIDEGYGNIGHSPSLDNYLEVFDHEVLHAFQGLASRNPKLIDSMYKIAKNHLESGRSIDDIKKHFKKVGLTTDDISKGFHKNQQHMTTNINPALKKNVGDYADGSQNQWEYLTKPHEQNVRHMQAIESLVEKYGYDYLSVSDDMMDNFVNMVKKGDLGEPTFLFRNLADDSGKALEVGSKEWKDLVKPILENAWAFPVGITGTTMLPEQRYGGSRQFTY